MAPNQEPKSSDRRVRKTRKHLRDALVSLILERGWDQVSVIDVCERADVARSTFYAHFVDKEDLLLSGFEKLHAELAEKRQGPPGSFGFIEALLDHARDHVRMFRALVGKQSGASVLRTFQGIVTNLMAAELEARGVSIERRPFVAVFLSGGFLEMLRMWLDRPARMDAKDLVAMFLGFAEGVVGSLVERK